VLGARWPKEKTKELIRLVNLNLTGSQIAREMKTTRSAISGRCHRLGIQITGAEKPPTLAHAARAAAPVKRPRPFTMPAAHKRTSMRSAPSLPKPTLETFDPVRISIAGLDETTCRWPLGDPKTADFAYCGRTDKARITDPYCIGHTKIAVDERPLKRL